MALSLLLRGMIVGVSIAAPVGPIGLLVIQRTLSAGRLTGFFSGLGAATADGIYGLIAAFGLTVVASLLTSVQVVMGVIGGLFLIWLGMTTFRKLPPAEPVDASMRFDGRLGLVAAWASTFLLTLTNPMTVLAFAAILSGAGLQHDGSGVWGGAWLVLGILFGSALWWLLVSGGVSLLRHHVTHQLLVWVNRGAGALLLCIGVYALISAWLV